MRHACFHLVYEIWSVTTWVLLPYNIVPLSKPLHFLSGKSAKSKHLCLPRTLAMPLGGFASWPCSFVGLLRSPYKTYFPKHQEPRVSIVSWIEVYGDPLTFSDGFSIPRSRTRSTPRRSNISGPCLKIWSDQHTQIGKDCDYHYVTCKSKTTSQEFFYCSFWIPSPQTSIQTMFTCPWSRTYNLSLRPQEIENGPRALLSHLAKQIENIVSRTKSNLNYQVLQPVPSLPSSL